MKPALIVGSTGQDGTLLAHLLKQRGIPILGLGRSGLLDESGQVISPVSLGDAAAMATLIRERQPSHVFYLAAHHHSAQDKFDEGQEALWKASFDVQVHGLIHVLEALRLHAPQARLFYASSSHVFGSPAESPQTEATPLVPENIYAITKVAGHHACRHYREQHGLFASVGILYNHESVYRADKFLSQKIVKGAVAIKQGRASQLALGDLAAQVDWGYAPDYIDAMVRILEVSTPGDYIIATGKLHTVRDFARLAFAELGLDHEKYVIENRALIRPQKTPLIGDASKLRTETGWQPTISFEEMVRHLTREAAQW